MPRTHRHKRCKFDGCELTASFGYKDGNGGQFCSKHKVNDMINLLCKSCNCGLHRPTYNFAGLPARFCKDCMQDGMVNVNDKLCFCQTSVPTFNYKGLKAEYCAKCRLIDMINVANPPCVCGLSSRPSFNYVGLPPKYCSKCKNASMIDVAHKCKNTNCTTNGTIKYNYYCAFCFQHLFPDTELAKNIRTKTKENFVRDYLKDNFDGFIHDIALWTGNCDCSHRRRIDFRILIGNTLLCIEVDENQHKRHTKTEEELRYDDLYMLHGGKFIFIRFNPDKFKSMLGTNKNPTMKKRMEYLHQEINFQIDRINCEKNEELLEISYLFYDGFHYTEC